ncbi:hypothetical protein FCM35_KLT09947 [Carex littledalei]|uniref:Core Histone H2A/H2B/H3 domain-containing protein n=1 Tax=Carex littledalei TaxID=544730 RepID=A0A833RJM1_9POAL|nr:hypothetical protein FCM35_KLT09947 [Carex littledalei]
MENQSQNQPEQQQLPELPPRYRPLSRTGLLPHQQYELDMLWKNHNQEVEHMRDFKHHQLPLTRMKRMMKANRDIKLVSSEAPVVLAKACEMFIHDLILRAWLDAVENHVCTIETINIYDAVCRIDPYKFLILPSSGSGAGINSSEVRGQSHDSSVGETNPGVTITEEEQPFGVNPGMCMDDNII